MFEFLLRIFLVCSAVFYLPSVMPNIPGELFIQYSAILCLGISFFIKRERDIQNKWLGGLFIYLFINTILSHFNPVNRMALVNLFLGIFLLKFIAERIKFSMRFTRSIGISFLILALMNTVFILLQSVNKDPIFQSINPSAMPQVDVTGLMGAKYALGAVSALSIPFIYSIHPVLCVFLVPLFIISKSSTSVIAGIVAFLFLLWHQNRSRAIVISILLLLAGSAYVLMFDMPTGGFSQRLNVWWAAIHLLRGDIWFGCGLGGWKLLNVMTTQETSQELKYWSWMHNDFLQLWAEGGILAMTLLYFYFKRIFFYVKSSVLKEDFQFRVCISALLALIIISFFHFPFHAGRLAGISIFILALVEARLHELHKKGVLSYEEIISVPMP